MRRFSLLVLPFLAAFALVFGLFYLYNAIQLIGSGYIVRGALVGVFGVTGVGLAVGIWLARRRTLRAGSPGVSNAPGDGPQSR